MPEVNQKLFFSIYLNKWLLIMFRPSADVLVERTTFYLGLLRLD